MDRRQLGEMIVIASVGLFGLWWVTLHPFFNWLF